MKRPVKPKEPKKPVEYISEYITQPIRMHNRQSVVDFDFSGCFEERGYKNVKEFFLDNPEEILNLYVYVEVYDDQWGYIENKSKLIYDKREKNPLYEDELKQYNKDYKKYESDLKEYKKKYEEWKLYRLCNKDEIQKKKERNRIMRRKKELDKLTSKLQSEAEKLGVDL